MEGRGSGLDLALWATFLLFTSRQIKSAAAPSQISTRL